MLMVTVYPEFTAETKIFLNVVIFVFSFFYKEFIQVFQER